MCLNDRALFGWLARIKRTLPNTPTPSKGGRAWIGGNLIETQEAKTAVQVTKLQVGERSEGDEHGGQTKVGPRLRRVHCRLLGVAGLIGWDQYQADNES